MSPPRVPVSRRTALEWIGQAAVLALTAPALLRCGGGGVDEAEEYPESMPPGDGPFSFRPGRTLHRVFEDLRERTVDEQDLRRILARWSLRVDGLAANPATFSFADLVSLPKRDQVTDFHCVEGWSVQDVPWNGVGFAEIARLAQPTSAATHVTLHTIGGQYNESLPLTVALEPNTLLAYGVAGSTLPFVHGFPLRLVVPRLLGYKNAKYIERIEFAAGPAPGYWTVRGYDYLGEVPASRLRPGRW